MNDAPAFLLEREFDAPRLLVWRTWTTPELLARWYGPGVESIVHKLDVRPGGVWLNEMKTRGGSFRERFEFLEVDEPEKLAWLQSSVDEDWVTPTPPQMENWPRVLRADVQFQETGDKTLMHFSWAPHAASAAENAAFAAAVGGLGQGWGAGMNAIDAILAELQG